MRMFLLTPVLFLVAGSAVQAQADDEARGILQKAIQAHGGKDKLSQVKAELARTRGTVQVPNVGALPFTAETYSQLPGQFKNVLRTEFQGQAIVLVQILDGDRAAMSVNGVAEGVGPRLLEEMQEARHAELALTLVPLLEGKGYKATALKEINIKGRPAVGVLVQSPGHKDYRMYFDTATSLLVKTERPALNHQMQEVLQEAYWSDYRVTAGVNRPARFAVYQNQQLTTQGEVVEVRYPDRHPADTFAISP
jgi:hypothetical protein